MTQHLRRNIIALGLLLLVTFLLAVTGALAYKLIIVGDGVHQLGKQLPRQSAASTWFLFLLFCLFDLLALVAGIRWWRERGKD